MKKAPLLFLLLVAACSQATPAQTAAPLHVQYTPASAPWIEAVYACAGKNAILSEKRAASFINPSADMSIRIGQSETPFGPAFRIGSEDILAVTAHSAQVASLSADQVEGIFSGRIDDWSKVNPGKTSKIQVWAFPGNDDVEQIFEGAVLGGASVTSLARLAASPEEMAQAVAGDANAIGILPGRWKGVDLTAVFTAATVPVLAMTPSDPTGSVRQILACLSH